MTQAIDLNRALAIATQDLEAWLKDEQRSEYALQSAGGSEALREQVLARVRSVLAHPRPAAANRLWLCELVRAWAPLEVLFPEAGPVQGATGHTDLRDVLDLIVNAEYGHMLAATGSLLSTCELLLTDRQKFTMEIGVACRLQPLLAESAAEDLQWLAEFKQYSLIMADYLHRNAIREPQRHDDALLQKATAMLSRSLRDARDACEPVRRQASI
jgi:hypothetical protein